MPVDEGCTVEEAAWLDVRMAREVRREGSRGGSDTVEVARALRLGAWHCRRWHAAAALRKSRNVSDCSRRVLHTSPSRELEPQGTKTERKLPLPTLYGFQRALTRGHGT